ncbi:LysM domain-containing protein [Ideonella sp. YS5]|uniref:LysM domain-containing protein n=1 Tax=Ideonella sp. YS5 TaxID=3453714 RepID=UPI003EECEE48
MANFSFSPTSRYYDTPVKTFEAADGSQLVYLARRFVPASSRFATLTTHVVQAGERIDLVAAATLGDPLAFWRLCDANDAMRPDELTAEPGRRLSIPLPEGIPGAPQA